MLFAMVFTISCSGDKGPRGANGIDGKSCTARPMPTAAQGWILSCGGEDVGSIWNGTDADGNPAGGSGAPTCHLAPSANPGYAFSLNCGTDVVNIPALGSGGGGVGGGGNCAVSQADEYNPFWLKMNCGATIDICLNGGAFDPADYVCTNGAKRTVDINRDYYNRGGYNTSIDLISQGGALNNDASIGVSGSIGKQNVFPSITSGILLPKKAFICNELQGSDPFSEEAQNRYYDPNKQFCYSSLAPAYAGPPYKLKDLCGANDFDANRKFCFVSKTGFKIVVSLCGGTGTGIGGSSFLYNQFCQTERNSLTGFANYYAAKSTVAALCGNNDWTGKITTDGNDEITNYNAGKYYNNWSSSNAIQGTVEEYGYAYNRTSGFGPSKGTISGGKQICDTDGVVRTQCGIPTAVSGNTATWVNNKILLFDARSQFCRDDIKNIGTADYTQKVEVVNLCRKTDSTYKDGIGGGPFDSKDYFCDNSDGKVKKKCLEVFYEDETQFCYKEGNTQITVGTKCKKDPTATGSNIEYLPAQYDPRKQFCTWKISNVTGQAGTCTSLDALQFLSGASTSGGSVGASNWADFDPPAVIGNTIGTNGVNVTQNTPYATNYFPACYNPGDISPATASAGAGIYTYEEVPEDMCKGNIKYNQGGWLWQSCLVTDKTDRTKDLYQHCGPGERPKADFTGCEKIAVRIPTGTCLATEVKDWDGHCKLAEELVTAGEPDEADCSGSVPGAVLTGDLDNVCSCPAGYVINSTSAPTKCRTPAFGSTAETPTWCDYSELQAPGRVATNATTLGTNAGCVTSAVCTSTAAGTLGTAANAGKCLCAAGDVWFSTNITTTSFNKCVTPTANKVFADPANSATQIWANTTTAVSAGTPDDPCCKVDAVNGFCPTGAANRGTINATSTACE